MSGGNVHRQARRLRVYGLSGGYHLHAGRWAKLAVMQRMSGRHIHVIAGTDVLHHVSRRYLECVHGSDDMFLEAVAHTFVTAAIPAYILAD